MGTESDRASSFEVDQKLAIKGQEELVLVVPVPVKVALDHQTSFASTGSPRNYPDYVGGQCLSSLAAFLLMA